MKKAVDWFRILAELRRRGLSQCEVARQLNIPRSTVRNWANGQSPRYEDGRALLMLWRRACYKLAENGQRFVIQRAHDKCDAHERDGKKIRGQ